MELDFEKYKADQFCSNSSCSDYGQRESGNIGTKSKKHRQVYCKSRKQSWVITKGTFFFNLKKPIVFVLEVLLLLSEGRGVNAVCRVKGVKDETVNRWIIKAADPVTVVTEYLERGMHLTQSDGSPVQLMSFDGPPLRSFIYKKKQRLRKRRRAERIEEIVGGL